VLLHCVAAGLVSAGEKAFLSNMKSIRLSEFDYSAPNMGYFVTLRQKVGLSKAVSGELFAMLLQVVSNSPYVCDALVVMPDHVHTLVHADAAGGHALSELVCTLKSKSVYLLKQKRLIQSSFWQRGYHEHVLRGAEDFEEKLNYIVNNPFRAGLVEVDEAYRHLYVAALEQGRHKAAPYAMEDS
jgi:REP element-mobilizing transposase RayT